MSNVVSEKGALLANGVGQLLCVTSSFPARFQDVDRIVSSLPEISPKIGRTSSSSSRAILAISPQSLV